MKKLILLTVILFGCAKAPDNSAEIGALQDQVNRLRDEQNSTSQAVALLTTQLNETMKLVGTVQSQLNAVLVSSQANEYQVYELGEMIATLQVVVNNQQAALAQLQTTKTIVKLIDFCDTVPNKFNEVGFRLSDGSTVVFFESKGNRFLTVLAASTAYQTTDGTNCNFTTNAQGLVCDNMGCR